MLRFSYTPHPQFPVGMPLVELQLKILVAKRVAVACAEIRKRHFIGATNPGREVVNFAGETMRRQPFDHRIRLEKLPIGFFQAGTQHAMQSNRVCRHQLFPFEVR